jgi:hypothetical protein
VPLPAVNIGGREIQPRVMGDLDARATLALGILLADPQALDHQCREAILRSAENAIPEEPTRLYVSHHLDLIDLPAEEPEALSTMTIERFLDAVHVRSIWLTPESDAAFLHVDDTVDEDATQYVLSVTLGRDRTIRSVDMES